MRVNRRTFLRGGLALGLGGWGWPWTGPRGRAWGASPGRLWALTIGINEGSPDLPPLEGAEADGQRWAQTWQTLYGSQGAEQILLLGATATREKILTTLEDDLPRSLQRDDQVVIYFSGYGQYAPPPDFDPQPSWETALPYLAILTASTAGSSPQALPLALVLDRLQRLTQRPYFLILDCGFAPDAQPFQGNFRSRSGSGVPWQTPIPSKNPFKGGTIISGAAPGQTAVETPQGGLFTTALVQSLWQRGNQTLARSLEDHSRWVLVPRLGRHQIPQWRSGKGSAPGPDFPLTPFPATEGQGILDQTSQTVQGIWGGLSPAVAQSALLYGYYDLHPYPEGVTQISQVTGIKGRRVTLTPPPPAPVVSLQERYRPLPKALGLTVALGADLDRIERVEATSAFGAIARVEAVINAGDSPADCVFNRWGSHQYTLCTEGGYPLLLPAPEESRAIKTVIGALEPALGPILARKWLTLLANGDRTGLEVQVRLSQPQPEERSTPQTLYDWRSPHGSPSLPPRHFLPPVHPRGPLQWTVENLGGDRLYGTLVGWDPHQEARGMEFAVDPLKSFTVAWTLGETPGIAQWFLILSRYPLPQTAAFFTLPDPPPSDRPFPKPIRDPLSWILTLVGELSAHPPADLTAPDEIQFLATTDWLGLPLMYQVLG